jgi:hypothetical protein
MKPEFQYHCAYFTTVLNTNLTGINIFAETMTSALIKFKEITGLDEPHYIIAK